MTGATSGYVEHNGARLYYESEGEGTPVTLIHACVAHLRMWDAQVAALSGRHRVIRYDLRGFGRSRTQNVPFASRDDLGAVLDALGVERTHLVGASCGGSLAVDFTLENPDRVRSLVLAASGLGGFDADEPEVDWDAVDRLIEARDWEAVVERETQIWTDGPGQPPTRVDPEVRERMKAWNLENYIADQDADTQRMSPPAAGRLAEIDVPTLVMWGTYDVSSIPATCEKLATDIRGARRHVFEGVAHMLNLERPAEFNALVSEFIDAAEAAEVAT